MAATRQIHATCVAVGGTGVLLRGPSGSGKSDLAIRLIDGGARLVADDRVDLTCRDGRLIAAAPSRLAGLVEVRGLGILQLEFEAAAAVGLVVDLVAGEAVERLPAPQTCRLLDVTLAHLELAPFEGSATAKVRLAVQWVEGHIMRSP